MSKIRQILVHPMMRWSLVVAWMVVIFLLSHESADGSDARSGVLVGLLQSLGFDGSVDLLSTTIRKAAHVTLYAVLGGLLVWALAAYRRVTAKLIAIAVAIACAYAITDELHQALIPGRSGEVRDVLIDTTGATAGAGLTGWALMRRARRFTTAAKSDTVGQ